MTQTIHLGFEVDGSAAPVAIPVRHMAVTGQTQESGKTTTLEALITRSGLRAIAFLTKRGEKSFTSARRIKPYFQDRADWQFVQSILEFTMKERMKWERAWIVRACRGAHSLADVQRNLIPLQAEAKNALSQDMYMLLGEYLRLIVPLIASLPKSSSIELHPGEISVMDLVAYPPELQVLVISSALDWIHKHEKGVISVIPEAWKFVPQGRNTPVRNAAENLVREGAALKNFVWIDSQDMAAVDKMVLRACAIWLIGVQRESNEIKRALSSMPAGLKKPKAGDVATLEIGQFFACFGSEIRKTYVQPAWLEDSTAVGIAAGRLNVHDVWKEIIPQTSAQEEDGMEWKAKYEEAQRQIKQLNDTINELRALLPSVVVSIPQEKQASAPSSRSYSASESLDNEKLYQTFKMRLIEEVPQLLLSITKIRPEIEVTVKREKLEMDSSTLDGRIAVLISDGFFDERRGNKDVLTELSLRGWPDAAPNVSKAFSRLVRMGFLRDDGAGRYKAVAGMKVNVLQVA